MLPAPRPHPFRAGHPSRALPGCATPSPQSPTLPLLLYWQHFTSFALLLPLRPCTYCVLRSVFAPVSRGSRREAEGKCLLDRGFSAYLGSVRVGCEGGGQIAVTCMPLSLLFRLRVIDYLWLICTHRRDFFLQPSISGRAKQAVRAASTGRKELLLFLFPLSLSLPTSACSGWRQTHRRSWSRWFTKYLSGRCRPLQPLVFWH